MVQEYPKVVGYRDTKKTDPIIVNNAAEEAAYLSSLPQTASVTVTGTFNATGQSSSIVPLPGIPVNIFFGVGAGAVQLEKRLPNGAWSQIKAGGVQLYAWTDFSAAFTEAFEEPRPGIEYRLNCTSLTTPIAYTIK